MKTLQIGMDWFPDKTGGGLERFYYDFTRSLSDLDVGVDGLVAGPVGLLEESKGRIYGFAPRHFSIFRRLYAERQLIHRLLKENNYDLVASHFVLYTFPILDQLPKRPLVMHFHGPWSIESRVESNKKLDIWLRKAMEQSVFARSARFIVLSQAFQDILHQNYQVPLNQIHIVPGGVDVNRFNTRLSKEVARTTLNWPCERKIIFTARRLSQRMGLENLIAAMPSICHHHPEILVLIAGKGDCEDALQRQIQEMGLTKHIRLLGYLPDQQLPLAYRAADFSVIPTVALEGFGLVVLESLASGTPILGTPVGGIPEILRPFCKDLIFSGCSTEAIQEGISDVISGKRRLPSSQDCELYVHQNYTWSIISRKIKEIYQHVINSSPNG